VDSNSGVSLAQDESLDHGTLGKRGAITLRVRAVLHHGD
jgi:hypothetical protein